MDKQQFQEMLGGRIKLARKAARMSQGELARRIDLSRQQISNIETGKKGSNIWTLARIAFACRVDLYMLFFVDQEGE